MCTACGIVDISHVPCKKTLPWPEVNHHPPRLIKSNHMFSLLLYNILCKSNYLLIFLGCTKTHTSFVTLYKMVHHKTNVARLLKPNYKEK